MFLFSFSSPIRNGACVLKRKNENMEFNDFPYCEKIAKIHNLNNIEM